MGKVPEEKNSIDYTATTPGAAQNGKKSELDNTRARDSKISESKTEAAAKDIRLNLERIIKDNDRIAKEGFIEHPVE